MAEEKLCEICEWEESTKVEAVGDWCLGPPYRRINVCAAHYCQAITAGINDVQNFKDIEREAARYHGA